MFRFAVMFLMLWVIPLEAKKYKLSVCAILQNEAPYLKEWIEFHRILGVEHFYLYNNRSVDKPLEVLKPYIEKGIVTYKYWPHVGQVYAQSVAYDDCLAETKKSSDWVAYIDIDEFLFVTTAPNLRAFLRNYEKDPIGAVCVNWQMYGTSLVKHVGQNELLIERLVLKAPRFYQENHHIKSIIRPKFTIKALNPHCFEYKEGYFAVDPNGKIVKHAFNGDVPVDEIRINHYWCRDEFFAYGEKLARLMRCYHWTEDQARNRIDSFVNHANEEQDIEIFRYVPKLKSKLKLVN